MAKIPFKVLSRTARIIGRENVASARGAIVELVKNAYDADSSFAFVCIDFCFDGQAEILSAALVDKYLASGGNRQLLDEVYELDPQKNEWVCRILCPEEKKDRLLEQFRQLNSICIFDGGEGMCEDVILNYWMAIGTDNKEIDYLSAGNRVKSGAKGIGRFALDRLGSECEMFTFFDAAKHAARLTPGEQSGAISGYKWSVDWNEFDSPSKLLDEVGADVAPLRHQHLSDVLKKQGLMPIIPDELRQQLPACGTVLRVRGLRDIWTEADIDSLHNDLSTLLPPREEKDFSLYLRCEQLPDKYGEVANLVCADFDCKIVASCDKAGQLRVTIVRNEYDVPSMPDELFEKVEAFQKFPYRKEDFERGSWTEVMPLRKLLSGMSSEPEWNPVGAFEFVMYYLKRSRGSSVTSDDYLKPLQLSTVKDRKQWLDINGGIKLFRDNFRVRPYGEKDSTAYDWLRLGEAKAKSPNALSRGSGYRIEPNSVSGCARISRVGNSDLRDKSSREGMQDTPEFRIFCSILRGIIGLLEKDRSEIASNIRLYKEGLLQKPDENDAGVKRAEEMIQSAKVNNKTIGLQYHQKQVDESEDHYALRMAANQIARLEEEKNTLEQERRILRTMATCGLVLTSFGHEFSGIKQRMNSRCALLERALLPLLPEKKIQNLEDWKNPYVLINDIRTDDAKLTTWLDFSLNTTQKKKRKKSLMQIRDYMNKLANSWNIILQEHRIMLRVDAMDEFRLSISELDLDSIFNNLILNSIEAFSHSKSADDRHINIRCELGESFVIQYGDSGPGISEDIRDRYDIFKALFTTKRDKRTGEEIGTGLGMWILATIVKNYGGDYVLPENQKGFHIQMTIPIPHE